MLAINNMYIYNREKKKKENTVNATNKIEYDIINGKSILQEKFHELNNPNSKMFRTIHITVLNINNNNR